MTLSSEPKPQQSRVKVEKLQTDHIEIQEVIDHVDGKAENLFDLNTPQRELYFEHGDKSVKDEYAVLFKARHDANRNEVKEGTTDTLKNPEKIDYKAFTSKEAGIEISTGRISFKVAGVQRDFRIRNDVIAKIKAITASKMTKTAKIAAIKKVVYTKLYQIIELDGSIKSNKWRVGNGKHGTKEFTSSFNSSNKTLLAEIAKYAKIKIPKPVKAEPVTPPPAPEEHAHHDEPPTPPAPEEPEVSEEVPEEKPVETSETTPENIKEILKALNFKRIKSLNSSKLKEYFAVLKKAVTEKQLNKSAILKEILPRKTAERAALACTDQYRNKLMQKIKPNALKHKNAYGKRWLAVIEAADRIGPNKLKHQKVLLSYLRTFGKIDFKARSYILEDKKTGSLASHEKLAHSHGAHKTAIDVFFKARHIKKEGMREIGPNLTAHAGGLVVSANGKWQGGGEKHEYVKGGMNTPISGNGVLILSLNGEYHYYSHMDSVKVKAGQIISAGTVIGKGGNTGVGARKGRGRHVHYEVHKAEGERLVHVDNLTLQKRLADTL
ncbi:M23 family metallopeptidase [Candidatus Gracilibacteria bacterium]|nr:M23 family metallopeptidase [Candidatus Gracilibacteria bacterium]